MFTPFIFCGIIFIMSKTLWIDTETLSFDAYRPDIIQLAGFIEIDNKIVEKFNWFLRPCVSDDDGNERGIWAFHQKNLGYTKDQILNEFTPASTAYNEFIALLDKYCDRYDPDDKFDLGGYNVQFDLQKISSWFNHFGNNYMFAYISAVKNDPMYIIPFIMKDYPRNKMKLTYMWDYLIECGMPTPKFKRQTHDARSDVLQTYWIWKKICEPSREAFLS